jgi:signal transduction histidine kinase
MMRDEFADTGQFNTPLGRVIAESWQRSTTTGLGTSTDEMNFHRVSDDDLQLRQQANANLMEVALPHLKWLSEWLANISHVAYLVDRDGIILFSTGTYDNAGAFGLSPGHDWSERTMGTNGAGTALAADDPVTVSPEHISGPFPGFTCMAAPVHDPEGQVCGAIDISTSAEDANEERLAVMAHIAFVIDRELAHRRAAATATQKIKDKERLLAEVSHELRTPLTAILGWTRLLQKNALNNDVATQAVEVIERNALKQAQFIEDLLDVSRCLAGELRLKCAPVELAPLMRNAVDSLQQTSEAKRQTLTLEIEDSELSATEHNDLAVSEGNELSVNGDARRLEQVISNLVSNAIKYTPEGGHIEVKLARVDSQALIQVRDNGIGINPKFLPDIFDYFRRANGASTERHEGLGLGLSIVREIVRLHGGAIEAHSEGEGRGATFRVLLPLSH